MKMDNETFDCCPWCGETPDVIRDWEMGSRDKFVVVKCTNDECDIKPRKTFKSSFQDYDDIYKFAKKAWNHRDVANEDEK